MTELVQLPNLGDRMPLGPIPLEAQLTATQFVVALEASCESSISCSASAMQVE